MPPRFSIGANEREKLNEALDYYRDRGADPGYQGHYEELFTSAFVDLLDGKGYADAVTSGTAAVYLSIAALDLPAGSHAVVSPITDPGTLAGIVHSGLTPVLADCAPGSYNTDAQHIAERIDDRTRVIVLVHCTGQAADVAAVAELARSRGLRLVEDASHTHGGRREGRALGTFGDVAAFSTMSHKAVVTGGAGGLVFATDRDLFRRAAALADRGKPRWRDGFDHRDPSYHLFPALNLNLDELSCAIGLASLGRLAETNRRRLDFVRALAGRLETDSAVCRAYPFAAGDTPFFCPVFVDGDGISCDKKTFAEAVRAEGIGLNPDFRYVAAEWPWLRPYLSDSFPCPNAVAVRDSSFNLYVHEGYGERELNDVTAAIAKVEAHFAIE
jgi:perosamine synthetase